MTWNDEYVRDGTKSLTCCMPCAAVAMSPCKTAHEVAVPARLAAAIEMS